MADKQIDRDAENRLVAAAIKGDQQAFGQIYDTHMDDLFRFIYARVEDRQTAEDITSDVFLKAWENLDGYQIRGAPFRAWLYRIARNAVIDHYRTRKQEAPLEAVINTHDEDSMPVAQKVSLYLESEEVLTAMHEITDDQRNVLILKFVQNLTTKEIAKILGKRQGAIRALQMRGLQSIAQVLEENVDDQF